MRFNIRADGLFASFYDVFVHSQGSQMCSPRLIAFFRVTRFAARKEIAEAVAVTAESTVFYRCEDVIPRFGRLTAIGANKIVLGVHSQDSYCLRNPCLVIYVGWCGGCCEGMVDRRSTTGKHNIGAEMRSDALDLHRDTLRCLIFDHHPLLTRIEQSFGQSCTVRDIARSYSR